jgi:hypothetical protein
MVSAQDRKGKSERGKMHPTSNVILAHAQSREISPPFDTSADLDIFTGPTTSHGHASRLMDPHTNFEPLDADESSMDYSRSPTQEQSMTVRSNFSQAPQMATWNQ